MSAKPKTAKPAATEPLEIAPNLKAASSSWNIPLAILKASKADGCAAFSAGGRVNRTAFFKWLETHKSEADQAVTLDLAKADKQELERERLRCQIELLRTRNNRERRELIPFVEACEAWATTISVVQEEAKFLMESDHYRVFCTRCKTRVATIHTLSPNEVIETIRRFYNLDK